MTRMCCVLVVLAVTSWRLIAFGDDPVAKEPPKQLVVSLIQPEPLRKHVEYLAGPELKGRGSPETRRLAAKYLVNAFRQLDLTPLWEDSYIQEIPGPRADDGTLPIWGLNVGGMLEGSDPKVKDEIIVIGVHYDHLGMRDGKIYPGADDNASSVAMMLEVARQLATGKQRPRRSIAFVGFDLEERLLWGSRWFAAHPPWPLTRVKLFITSDLLGRSLGDLPLPVVFVMGSERGTGLVPLLNNLAPPSGMELARLGTDIVGTRSDYGPFRDERVPFLFFSIGEHPDYHTPRDTPDKLNYVQLASISNVILHLVRHMADAAETPTWIKDPVPDMDEPRTINRITSLLRDGERNGEIRLTSLQNYVVTQAHDKTSQLLKKGQMTKEERGWLLRSAQALLYSVF